MTQRYVETPIFDVPWKSQWRKDLEARFGEPVRYVAPKPVAKARVKREKRVYSNCACGRPLLKKASVRCRSCHIKNVTTVRVEKDPVRVCVRCPAKLNKNNKHGFCPRCYKANRRMIEAGAPKPKCSHPGCLEKISRSSNPNRIPMCPWHHPKYSRRSAYRKTFPKMEAA